MTTKTPLIIYLIYVLVKQNVISGNYLMRDVTGVDRSLKVNLRSLFLLCYNIFFIQSYTTIAVTLSITKMY